MAITDEKENNNEGVSNGRNYGTMNGSTPPTKGRDEIDDLKAVQHIGDVDDHDARALSNFQRFSYGVGHVLNDLTASMWFSYMLIFLQKVELFDNMLAGNLILIGQISDALCTPFVGLESDRTSGVWKLGKRKTWHAVGTFSVMASFVFLFTRCINCYNTPSIAQFVYYTPFVVIFQFGWAATQISHLSYSSDITPYKHERVALQSIRNSFTVVANLSVYGLLTLLFYLGDSDGDTDNITQDDAPEFQSLAIICLGMGTVFNFIFYFGTKGTGISQSPAQDSQLQPGDSSIEISTYNRSLMTWKDWLKNLQFYQIALLYMATRLYINVSQVYFAMYLTETLYMPKTAIAMCPLVSYVSSFLTSLTATTLNRFLGRKTTYVVAVGIGAASCVWMYFCPEQDNQVYGCAVLMGMAGSLLLITSLSMTSDLIGSNIESGAFVFGAMSFTDKLSNGLAVELIQYFHPCTNCCPACEGFYRKVQTFVPGGALALGFIALLFLLPQNIGVREKKSAVLTQVTYEPPYTEKESNGHVRSTPTCRIATPPCTTPVPPACDAVTHCAEVHNQFESPFDYMSEDEIDVKSIDEERRSLLGSLNTQDCDVGVNT